MNPSWLNNLSRLVEDKPLVVLRFAEDEWQHLHESRRGIAEFTIARPHSQLEEAKIPTACIIQARDDEGEELCFGLISSKSPITTLESRIKVKGVLHIAPNSISNLLGLIKQKTHANSLTNKLSSTASVLTLTPKLSSYLIELLASIPSNHGAMRSVASSLSYRKNLRGIAALQEDAVQMALHAFGLPSSNRARSVELAAGQETALEHVSIMEDSVIEHDARYFDKYDLVQSDITGRAVFRRENEQLEIFTANRRPLERVFGVDLIYFNSTRQNIVMVQYKMLERSSKETEYTDWNYRPDGQLDEEIRRMRLFESDNQGGPYEYRLNPTVFYLKFVKRDGQVGNGSIVIPIDHFEKLRTDPDCVGPRGGVRVSFESLSGRYLRHTAFLDLIRSGYIGAHADTTKHLRVLVEAVLKNNRAVVAAIQQTVKPSIDDSDSDDREDIDSPDEFDF